MKLWLKKSLADIKLQKFWHNKLWQLVQPHNFRFSQKEHLADKTFGELLLVSQIHQNVVVW